MNKALRIRWFYEYVSMKNFFFVLVFWFLVCKLPLNAMPDIPKIEIKSIKGRSFTIKFKSLTSYNLFSLDLSTDNHFIKYPSGTIQGSEYDVLKNVYFIISFDTINIEGLQYSSVYYLRLRSIGIDGASRYTSTYKIRTNSFSERIIFERNPSDSLVLSTTVTNYSKRGDKIFSIEDLDGDGLKDVVAIEDDSNRFVWFRNIDGNYESTPNIIGTTNSYIFVTLDVENDGDVDIVFGSRPIFGAHDIYPNHGITLLLNDGDGNFNRTTIKTSKAIAPLDMEVIDVDGDTYKDIILSNSRPNSYSTPVFEYNGSSPSQRNDGELILLKNDYGIFHEEKIDGLESNDPGLNNWDNNFSLYREIEVGDIDCDGDEDIVTLVGASSSSKFGYRKYLNDGTGKFSREYMFTHLAIVSAFNLVDYNEDGYLDIVLGTYNFDIFQQNRVRSQYVSVAKNNGHGSFSTPQKIGKYCCFDNLSGKEFYRGVKEIDVVKPIGIIQAGTHGMDYRSISGEINDIGFKNIGGPSPREKIGYHFYSVKIDDIDSDGSWDLVVGSNSKKLEIYRNSYLFKSNPQTNY